MKKNMTDIENKNSIIEKELKTYEEESVKTKNDIILKDISIKSFENKINALSNQLNSTIYMNESLKKSLDDLEKYVDVKKETIVTIDNNIDLQKELDYERDRVVKLQNDINLYKNECNRLTIQINDFEKANIELENKLMFMSQKYMKDINTKTFSLENELKLKACEEDILTLKSKNKGLNDENLKLIDENFLLRYNTEHKKCFCCIQ